MDALISLKHLPQFAGLCFSGKMVESKKALPKETRPSYYGNYGPPFAAAAAMAMAAAAAARQGDGLSNHAMCASVRLSSSYMIVSLYL